MKALQSAMTALNNAGAQTLPNEMAVQTAKDGTTWNGKKSNGESWSLTKNHADSYNCVC